MIHAHLFKVFLLGLCALWLAPSAALAAHPIEGTWNLVAGRKPYTITLQRGDYPGAVAPLSGSIQDPKKKEYALIPCSDQQMSEGPQGKFYPYLNGRWQANCSYMVEEPGGNTYLVLRVQDFVWILVPNGAKALGQIYSSKNQRPLVRARGQKKP